MITNYYARILMGNIFQTDTSIPLPTNYYLAVSSTLPTASGTNVTEPPSSGSAYKRILLSNLEQLADGIITNSDVISYPESTSNWGTIPFYGVFDSMTGGNLIMYGEFDSPRTVEDSTVFSVKKGGLKLQIKDAAVV